MIHLDTTDDYPNRARVQSFPGFGGQAVESNFEAELIAPNRAPRLRRYILEVADVAYPYRHLRVDSVAPRSFSKAVHRWFWVAFVSLATGIFSSFVGFLTSTSEVSIAGAALIAVGLLCLLAWVTAAQNEYKE